MIRAGQLPETPVAAAAVKYACPRCRSERVTMDAGVTCAACGATYSLLNGIHIDFTGPILGFEDWWAESAEATERWLADEAPKEEAFQVGVARNYVIPLLRELGYAPGRASLLSGACGLGAEVDFLNDAGYATWGVDYGSRIVRWPERRYPERLARADLFRLPFVDGAFDFVMALNVLEHVGTVGDSFAVTEDYQEQRRAAIAALLGATKPGGYVLLGCINRRFPLDFFHTQETRWARVRVHTPWERFGLSYGDHRRLSLSTGLAEWARPLPLRGFFSYLNLRRSPARPLLPIVDWLLGGLPVQVYGSWLSFFTIVLVRRNQLPADRAASINWGVNHGSA